MFRLIGPGKWARTLTLVLFSSSFAAAAVHGVPTNAELVLVRSDCPNSPAPAYCFSSIAAVNAWIPTRTPAHNPVLVDIGPGDWDRFVCNNQNHISLRGSGRSVTRLIQTGEGFAGAIDVNNCASLDVSDLTAHGTFAGVAWTGGGTSTWNDVELSGGGPEFPPIGFNAQGFSYAWYDKNGETCPSKPLHYFYGSRLQALGNALWSNIAYQARCGESWFYGSEITATHASDESTGTPAHAAFWLETANTDIRVFGGAIRSNIGQAVELDASLLGSLVAVRADAGEFHMHGGIINASALGSTLPLGATGLETTSSVVRAHTPGTAFVVMAAPGGTAVRLSGPSDKTQSPFLWQQSDAPPAIASLTGADLFVEVDCAPGGSCTGGSDPHLMVYSAPCGSTGTGGPWFDTVMGDCRLP